MLPQKNEHLIYCDSEWGPVFGDGHDLKISDSCHLNQKSWANFPSTYNRTSNPYNISQKNIQEFSGVVEGKNFKVEEYEVFRVLEDESCSIY